MTEQTTLDIILLMLAIFGLLALLTIVAELIRIRLPLGQTFRLPFSSALSWSHCSSHL